MRCRDVTPPCSAQQFPDRRIIEAVVRISPRIANDGKEADVKEIVYEFTNAADRYRIRDYAPQTQTATDVQGSIMVVESTEENGRGEVGYKLLPGAAFSLEAETMRKANVKLERLPPRQVLVASGILRRGHGVFFKIRRSSQTTLEEKREFSFLFEAPADWRSDVFTLRCEATAYDRGLTRFLDREIKAGAGSFSIGFHFENDVEAEKRLFEVVGRRQAELDALAAAERRHDLGLSLSVEAVRNVAEIAGAKAPTVFRSIGGRTNARWVLHREVKDATRDVGAKKKT
ncbi:MAG: hypothetical protein ACRDD1_17645, partial [Planctomycetia bacterium]